MIFVHYRLVDLTNDIFSWVMQLLIWQAISSLVVAIKLLIYQDAIAGRKLLYAINYYTEMLCYCYLADDINRKVRFKIYFTIFSKNISGQSVNLGTHCFERLYAAEDMIIGDWKSLQVMGLRCESQPMVIRGGPFYLLNLRTFIAVCQCFELDLINY
jgi:hypothetical protein